MQQADIVMTKEKPKAEAIKYKIARYEKELKNICDAVNATDYSVCDTLSAVLDAIEYINLSKLPDHYVIQIGQPILDMLEAEVPDCPNNYIARLEADKARDETGLDYQASVR